MPMAEHFVAAQPQLGFGVFRQAVAHLVSFSMSSSRDSMVLDVDELLDASTHS